jgi:hypothetical protein
MEAQGSSLEMLLLNCKTLKFPYEKHLNKLSLDKPVKFNVQVKGNSKQGISDNCSDAKTDMSLLLQGFLHDVYRNIQRHLKNNFFLLTWSC